MASIPGLAKYPDLEQKFQQQITAVKRRARGKCSSCELSQVYRRFRRLLAERQRRDKSP